MLSQKYRFHSRGGVRYTLQKGIYHPNSRGYQRFGVVVSKKVLKSAVGRNRIRRRVYEAIRAELPNFPHPYDCLFVIYNKSILRLPFSELRTLIHDLLQRTLA